ncbi:MAG: beta strand repeat-containing protein [Thermoguttaceae bacterium]
MEPRLMLSVDMLTFHNDISRSGLNASETQLTPANVQVGSFGKLFTTALDGQVYTQPLVDTGVTIDNGVNTTSGAAGVYDDVVFVATEHDSLYAIDASPGNSGTVLWQRSFTITTPGYSGSTPGSNINNTFGATSITTVLSSDVDSTDISPEIGITGTPVIDPNTGILYVVVATKETISGAIHFVQRLHAINVSDGTDEVAPYLIGDTTNGNTNNTQIYVYGTGDGSVTDPYNGTGESVVQFNALTESERGALSLVNNTVYVEWASHGDNGPYHGWVVDWNVANLTTTGFVLSGVFNTSPNDGLSGIWQGGGALTFESDGSAFYFETGNGSGGAPTLNANGFPTDANYGEAVVKVVADTQYTTPPASPQDQNPNGWGLKVADYFIPYNVAELDGTDDDLGSGAPLILPASAGLPGHPNLLVAAGKEGKIYLIDRDDMGHFDPNNDNVLNAVPDGSGQNTPPVQLSGSLSTPAWFNGTIYWTSGYSSYAYAFTIASNGTLVESSQTTATFGYLPGSVVISANGDTDGIVWVMDRNENLIHAYDANTLATELWNSGQAPGGGDNLGEVDKMNAPTVANGEVFVGTSDSLVVYGLVNPPTAPPNQPTLSATLLSGSSLNLTWTDTTTAPNTATGYAIEDSTDGTNFSILTTAPAASTSLAIGGLQPLTQYYFRIYGFNSLGDSPFSAVVSITTTSTAAALDFSAGFAGSQSQLTFNSTTALNGSELELTNGGTYEAASAFSTSPIAITQFTTQFTFQLTAGANTADGFTFCIQGTGPNALGPDGGGLGYGPDSTSGSGGIGNSVAIKFDLYNNAGEGPDSTGLYTDGASPTNVGSIDLTGSGIDLHSGDTMQVTMNYDGSNLTVTINDPTDGASATQTYAINIPSTVGGSTAYVGFTAGSGGLTATQNILTWTYSPITVSPNAPSGLGASPASATSISLNWTNNATDQTGFHLDRATDAAFTQNLITQTLPATPNTFTDTYTGLAPGNTYYYRLRAFNSTGDSGNSNVVSVTIPLAPPKPTNQQVTNVTTTEIDMSWQDNAGHQADGYEILRAVNHGTFTQVATLPLTSHTPPSTYLWADTNLTPGSYYEYHIIAYNVSGNNDFAGLSATTLTLAPSALAASAGNQVVNLTWTAPPGAVSYNIYRGTTPGGEASTPLASGITATSYSDNTAVNGTTYYYVVTAVNGNVAPVPAESAPSNEVSATPATLVLVPTLPNWTVNLAYGQTLATADGTPPDTFKLTTGSLPTGLTMNASTGVISGTPTATGTSSFSVTVTDSLGVTASQSYSLTINPPLLLSPSSLPAGTMSVAYNQSFTASGGTGSIAFSESGTLPAGLTFTPGTGTLSGTPTASGTFNLSVTATDSVGATASHNYSLTVNPVSTNGITRVQDASMGYSTTSNATQATGAFSKNPTIGNYIVVWFWAWDDSAGWTSSDVTCSDNLATHNTYTQVGFVQSGCSVSGFFYAKVTSTGAGYTPIITVNSLVDPSVSVAASEFSGIAASNPVDGTAVTATGRGNPASVGSMSAKATDLVLAGLSWDEDSAVTIAEPSGWTRSGNALDDAAIDPSGDTQYGDAIYQVDPSGPTAPSWTVSGGTTSGTDTWCASQVAFLSANSANVPLSLSPSSLPASTVGVAYSQKITASGGTGSITLSESGTLPAGLTFTASTGTFSGTPTASGTFSVNVTATDSVGDTASQSYSLTINPALSLSPSSLPASTVGVAYSQKVTASGGTGSIAFSESGPLPAGLTFTASTGILSGTPTASGSFSFSVTVTDSVGAIASQSYSLTINPALSLSPSSLPASTVGVAYSQKFTASGGTGSITLSESGTLPAGLTFTPSTGTLSGTPSASGSYPFSVKATDSVGATTTQSESLTINPALSLSPSSLPASTVGVAYSQKFTASGGTGSIAFSESGTLPAGLTFTASTGILSGTPTASGTYVFSVTATDSVGATTTESESLTINLALSLSPSSLPAGTVGVAYSQKVTASGGTGSITLSESGTLPAGLTFTASTGTFSGTPTASGTYAISVKATDSVGATASQNYSLTVNPGSSSGITWVQAASMGYSTTPNATQATGAFSKSPTIGNYIVVWFWAWDDSAGWTSSDVTCSDNLATHNTYTQVGFVQSGCSVSGFFYAKVTSTGAGYTPIITVHSLADPSISVAASEFSGIAASNPIDGTAVTATGTGSPASVGSMSAKATDLVLAGLSWDEDSAVTIAEPSGWTRSGNALDDAAIDPSGYTQYGDAIYQMDPSGPTAPSWTVSGGTTSGTDKWCASQVAFLA